MGYPRVDDEVVDEVVDEVADELSKVEWRRLI